MPAVYEIRFLPEGRIEELSGSRGNYYEFPDGRRMEVETTPVWCRPCGRVTEGEEVETLAQIDRELADLHDPTSERYRSTQRPPRDDGHELRLFLIDRARRRRTWREVRVSPAKCLACGSADIVVFPDQQPVPHPAGTGTVTVACVGLCTTLPTGRIFTPAGVPIAGKHP